MAYSNFVHILMERIKGLDNKETTSNHIWEAHTIKHSDYISLFPRVLGVIIMPIWPMPNRHRTQSYLTYPTKIRMQRLPAVEEMLTDASVQRFTKARFDDLQKIVMSRLAVFRTNFWHSLASSPPLRLEIKPCTKHVHAKIRKYSDRQGKLCTSLSESYSTPV